MSAHIREISPAAVRADIVAGTGLPQDMSTATAVEGTSDLIATGHFADTLDFGQGEMTAGSTEALFLVKLGWQ